MTTYAFPDSENTYFYALGNNGTAAGHYEDSDGLHHGVFLTEAGALTPYDFPGSVETEIYGISDATGALTGNWTDASGMRRGFSGETVIEVPEASATFTNFTTASGAVVGSYIGSDGLYHPYVYAPDGRFIFGEALTLPNPEYLFTHGINDVGVIVVRAKAVDDVPRTYVGQFGRFHAFEVPGSVSTEGYNINQDGSVVGTYTSADGRTHGFFARPADEAVSDYFSNVYNTTLYRGLNMISVPLAAPTPMTAKSLVALTGATTIIQMDAVKQRFVAWTPSAPTDGFPIEGGKGYIVNVPKARKFAFIGAPWTDPTETTETAAASPSVPTELPQEAWAFVVAGHLEGKNALDGYHVSVRNLRTNGRITAPVEGDYFAAATADLARRSVVEVGDVIQLQVIGPRGTVESETLRVKVTPQHVANAVLSVRLDNIGTPTQNLLLQNYPNPFNPETWIPYQLATDTDVKITIYASNGGVVRTLLLGHQTTGYYTGRDRAAYWDGRNTVGEPVASGIYFYQLTTPSFHQTRRLVIVK